MCVLRSVYLFSSRFILFQIFCMVLLCPYYGVRTREHYWRYWAMPTAQCSSWYRGKLRLFCDEMVTDEEDFVLFLTIMTISSLKKMRQNICFPLLYLNMAPLDLQVVAQSVTSPVASRSIRCLNLRQGGIFFTFP